jgi:hypothetical protein
VLLVHLLIGALATAALLGLFDLARRRHMTVPIWAWVLTVLGLLFGVFVIEVIATLLAEGAPQAALVSGILLGLIAVIWGVLLGRYVFAKPVTAAA